MCVTSLLVEMFVKACTVTLQIVKRARLDGITSEGVLKYFADIIVPEIRARQMIEKPEVRSIGDLLHDLVEVVPTDKKYRVCL